MPRRTLQDKRCLIQWIWSQQESLPSTSGLSSVGSTQLPRLLPWILTQSLIKEVLTRTRNSLRLLLTIRAVLRPWSCTGICWRSSLIMTLTRTVSSRWQFPSMMKEFLTTPLKHSLAVPAEDQFEALFKKYDPRNDGRLTIDEWMSLAKEEVYKKFL